MAIITVLAALAIDRARGTRSRCRARRRSRKTSSGCATPSTSTTPTRASIRPTCRRSSPTVHARGAGRSDQPSRDSWQTIPAEPDPANPPADPGIFNVKSGAEGTSLQGQAYTDFWASAGARPQPLVPSGASRAALDVGARAARRWLVPPRRSRESVMTARPAGLAAALAHPAAACRLARAPRIRLAGRSRARLRSRIGCARPGRQFTRTCATPFAVRPLVNRTVARARRCRARHTSRSSRGPAPRGPGRPRTRTYRLDRHVGGVLVTVTEKVTMPLTVTGDVAVSATSGADAARPRRSIPCYGRRWCPRPWPSPCRCRRCDRCAPRSRGCRTAARCRRRSRR